MQRRTIRYALGCAAVATLATGGSGALASTATFEEATPRSEATSHWFTQVEPQKGQGVFIRNGTTPAAPGPYGLAITVTSKHHDLKCFAEGRDGADLGGAARIKAGNHDSVTLAESVPAHTQYNLMCYGTSTQRRVLHGTITETAH